MDKSSSHSIWRRIIATFLIAAGILIAITLIFVYRYVYWYEHKLTDQMGYAAADSCAVFFGSIALDDDGEYRYDPDDYAERREMLRDLCKQSHMAYMYAYKCDPENNTVTYIMCVAANDADDERMARERGFGTVVEVELSEEELKELAGEDVPEALVRDNQYGAMISWFEEVEDWDNVLAGADYSIEEQRSRVFQLAATIIIPYVLVVALLLIIQLRFLNRRVFVPVQTISNRMKSFTASHAGEFEPFDFQTNDEIGEIATAFEGMAADIDAYLDDIERMTAERARVDVELDVARRIQLGMVPEQTALCGDTYGASAIVNPAREVGGDFYDCFELDNGCIAAVVGDVSGKGLAAALFMAMTKTTIHDGLLAGTHPADVLNQANEVLCTSNPEGMFVTALACVYDPRTGEAHLVNAGHVQPIIVGDSVRRLEMDPGVLLGLFEGVGLEEQVIVLQPGESLLLITDGVTEALSAEGVFFGEDRLKRTLQERAPFETADQVVDAVAQSVDAFTVGRERFDDTTILALHRNVQCDATQSGKRAMLAVDMTSFAAVRSEIMEKAPDRAFGLRACLACEEAFVNIVSYSGASGIWCSVDEGENGLRVVLEDDGVPFDPLAGEAPSKQFEELDEGGMGIGLIRATAREVSYHRIDGHNVLDLLF